MFLGIKIHNIRCFALYEIYHIMCMLQSGHLHHFKRTTIYCGAFVYLCTIFRKIILYYSVLLYSIVDFVTNLCY